MLLVENENIIVGFSNTYPVYRQIQGIMRLESKQHFNILSANAYYQGTRTQVSELGYGFQEEHVHHGNILYVFISNQAYKLLVDYVPNGVHPQNPEALAGVINTYEAFSQYARFWGFGLNHENNQLFFTDFVATLQATPYGLEAYNRDRTLGFLTVPNVRNPLHSFCFVPYRRQNIITYYKDTEIIQP